MRIEKVILGLLLLPFIISILIVLLPLILLFGIISIVTGRSFIKKTSFQWQNASVQKESDDDVIDVEVIRSENSGEQNDISGRSLR